MGKITVLEGARVFLRKARVEDVTEEHIRWMNDMEVIQYLEARFFDNTREKLEEYIIKMNKDPNCRFFSIVDKKTFRFIGNIKLSGINKIHGLAEVSLWIGSKDCWGKGYGTEAIKLIVDYAFNILCLRKLTAGAYEPNFGSIKAFQKAGFAIEGKRAKHFLYGYSYVDEVLMAIFYKK